MWQQRLDEKSANLDQTRTEMSSITRDYDETTKQIETDADREILAIKNKYCMVCETDLMRIGMSAC